MSPSVSKEYQRVEVPLTLDEIVPRLVKSVADSLKSVIIEKAITTAPFTLNLMYSNPRLGVLTHIVPDVESQFPGLSSPLFRKLKALNPAMPNDTEIRALVTHALQCPHALASVRALSTAVWTVRYDDKPLVSLPQPDEVLSWLLGVFRNWDEKNLAKLDKQRLLFRVVQCLLLFLPQFPDTRPALMRNFLRPPMPLADSGQRFRWVTEDDKENEWKGHAKEDDVRSRVFFLLSAVESLQWSGPLFGIADRLYDFLAADLGSNFGAKLALPLCRVALYVNCERLTEDYREALVETLRAVLRGYIDYLTQLVMTLSFAFTRSAVLTSADLCRCRAATVVHSVLNLMSPSHIFAYDLPPIPGGAPKPVEHAMRRMPLNELVTMRDSEGCPGILRALGSPWGVYTAETTSDLKTLFSVPLDGHIAYDTDFVSARDPEHGQYAMRFSTDCRSELAALRAALPFFGQLVQEVDDWHTHVMNGIRQDWYLDAFDEYYYAFDVVRQEDVDVPEFKLRKLKEVELYKTMISALREANRQDITVLDVGMGYGRLARKIRDENMKYIGVDISRVMLEKAKENCPWAQQIECEMSHIADSVPSETVDLAILAFTTFGCYDSDLRNVLALRGVFEALRPGGLLVLEQHDPLGHGVNTPFLEYPARPVCGENVRLVKTTAIIPQGDAFSLYQGDYVYIAETERAAYIVKRVPYRLRLYTPTWLTKVLGDIGFAEIAFCADFDRQRDYEHEKGKATCMICIARKGLSREKLLGVWRCAYELRGKIKDRVPEVFREFGLGDAVVPDPAGQDDIFMQRLGLILREEDTITLTAVAATLGMDGYRKAAEVIRRIGVKA